MEFAEVENDGSGLGPSSSWTVSQLKDYLKLKGGRFSGKKSELVERSVPHLFRSSTCS